MREFLVLLLVYSSAGSTAADKTTSPSSVAGACRLSRHPGVEYQCSGNSSDRECGDEEPAGTIARPRCKAPTYYSPAPLPLMSCVDSSWDNYPTCTPECGRLTPQGTPLVLDGTYSNQHDNSFPWHTMIFKTTEKIPYRFLCSGSLISTSVVISAAHCFWRDVEKLLPASQFAAAVGKVYREWDNPKDTTAQKSKIRDIKIPALFQGAATNYQSDIAVLIMISPFQFTSHVRPVCLDFDYAFEKHQLQSGTNGKLLRWASNGDNDENSPALEVVDMAYLEVDKCLTQTPSSFWEFITSDSICASLVKDNTTTRHHYSGSGLVFPEYSRGVQRYYLRGVASTAPMSETHDYPIIVFTQVIKHQNLIKEYLE